jgi:hypothetical protein
MAADIPSREPESFVAGDTLRWTRSITDYTPADGWAISYSLRQSGGTVINITGSTLNGDHYVNVAAATTAGYGTGLWQAEGYVTKSATSERVTVFNGTIHILPNLATQTSSYDGRTHAKKVLDAIESVQLAEASKTLVQWSGLELSISRMSLLDRAKLRDRYLVEYRQEQQAERVARGLGTGRNVLVRFDRP